MVVMSHARCRTGAFVAKWPSGNLHQARAHRYIRGCTGSIAALVARTPQLCTSDLYLAPRRSLAMAPKRRGARAAPKAKRGRAGDSQRLRVPEADTGAVIEPPLAVANHPQRLVHFHREDDKVSVELTSMWRWLSGTLKATQGDERLGKTLRRRGYNGARFTAPMDGPGHVKHVEWPSSRMVTSWQLSSVMAASLVWRSLHY